MAQDALLTTTEVGRLIGKSGRTVSRLVKQGALPYASRLDVGRGVYLFRREDVDAYLAGRDEPDAVSA